jgi:hypothetical protein
VELGDLAAEEEKWRSVTDDVVARVAERLEIETPSASGEEPRVPPVPAYATPRTVGSATSGTAQDDHERTDVQAPTTPATSLETTGELFTTRPDSAVTAVRPDSAVQTDIDALEASLDGEPVYADGGTVESSFDPSGWTPEAQAVLEEHLKACEDQLREMERQLEGVTVPVSEEPVGSPDLKALDDEMGELMAALEASTDALRSTQSKAAATFA